MCVPDKKSVTIGWNGIDGCTVYLESGVGLLFVHKYQENNEM